jgi:hypothetical protein
LEKNRNDGMNIGRCANADPGVQRIGALRKPATRDGDAHKPVVVAADPSTCGFQFDPLGQRKSSSDCDKVNALLLKMGVP